MGYGCQSLATGHIEQTDEGIALVSAAGTGMSFDPGFSLGGGFSATWTFIDDSLAWPRRESA